MDFKTQFIFSIFAVNKPKLPLFARSAPKKAIFGPFLTNFSQNIAVFFKKPTPNPQISVYWKNSRAVGKNSSILRKNSSFSASKLNEPVVTNYTRFHKSVEKKAWLKRGCWLWLDAGNLKLTIFNNMDPKECFKIEVLGYLQKSRFHCRGSQNLPLCEKKPFLAI